MADKRSNRPLPWLLFGIGGFLTAFFFPIHIFLYGIALPLGWLPDPGYRSTLELVHLPLTRIYLGVLLILAFWHAFYRIRDTICDAFDVRPLDVPIAAVCYAGAITGTIATVVILILVP
jgi:fumarate reductase subunit D